MKPGRLVFVVAFAPDPDHGSVGGHDWYYHSDAAAEGYARHRREHPTDYVVLFPLSVPEDADPDTITTIAQEKADTIDMSW